MLILSILIITSNKSSVKFLSKKIFFVQRKRGYYYILVQTTFARETFVYAVFRDLSKIKNAVQSNRNILSTRKPFQVKQTPTKTRNPPSFDFSVVCFSSADYINIYLIYLRPLRLPALPQPLSLWPRYIRPRRTPFRR